MHALFINYHTVHYIEFLDILARFGLNSVKWRLGIPRVYNNAEYLMTHCMFAYYKNGGPATSDPLYLRSLSLLLVLRLLLLLIRVGRVAAIVDAVVVSIHFVNPKCTFRRKDSAPTEMREPKLLRCHR